MTIDSDSSDVRLVGYTTQEYFSENRSTLFPSARTDVVSVIFKYLSFKRFGTGINRTKQEIEERKTRNLLLEYAASNLRRHLSTIEDLIPEQNLAFFMKSPHVVACANQVRHNMIPTDDKTRWPPNSPLIPPITMAAECNLPTVIEILISQGTDVNEFTAERHTAAHAATYLGRWSIL